MYSRKFALLYVALAALFFVGCSPQSAEPEPTVDPEVARLEARAAGITIIRDDFGVPHIYAKTDADAVFGMLFAQAEDDFPRVEQNYIWATGRLAEVEGEAALYSDLRARLYMTVDEAKAAYESAPQWLKDLCDAYADGLNWYLHTHPEVKPRLLTRFEPWFPMFFSEGSIGGDIESISVDGIEAFYGGDNPAESLRASLEPERQFKEPSGSNGFAISGDHTASGDSRGQRGGPERIRRRDLGTVLRVPGIQREHRVDAYVDAARFHGRVHGGRLRGKRPAVLPLR